MPRWEPRCHFRQPRSAVGARSWPAPATKVGPHGAYSRKAAPIAAPPNSPPAGRPSPRQQIPSTIPAAPLVVRFGPAGGPGASLQSPHPSSARGGIARPATVLAVQKTRNAPKAPLKTFRFFGLPGWVALECLEARTILWSPRYQRWICLRGDRSALARRRGAATGPPGLSGRPQRPSGPPLDKVRSSRCLWSPWSSCRGRARTFESLHYGIQNTRWNAGQKFLKALGGLARPNEVRVAALLLALPQVHADGRDLHIGNCLCEHYPLCGLTRRNA